MTKEEALQLIEDAPDLGLPNGAWRAGSYWCGEHYKLRCFYDPIRGVVYASTHPIDRVLSVKVDNLLVAVAVLIDLFDKHQEGWRDKGGS